jgi:hypothetical protein
MSEGTDRNRDYLRAGLFVSATLALGIGTFVALQKVSWSALSNYSMRFRVENGITGLSPGSEIRVGGLRKGRILSIKTDAKDGVLSDILVSFEIDASLVLYRNAKAVRVAPLLGNTAWINFMSLGNQFDENEDGEIQSNEGILPIGGEIVAIEAPGLLANIAGSKSAEEIVTIISRAEKFTEILERAPKDYEEQIVPALEAARVTIETLRDDYGKWRTTVDSALTRAENAAKNLEEGTANANVLIAEARETLAENRPTLGSAMTELESAAKGANEAVATVRTQTIPRIAEVLNAGLESVDNFSTMLDRLDGEVAARMPDLRSFMGDVRVAASQLKLATIEVRRSPWRLLYRPTTEVLENEQLYEATRAFAAASADLRTAAEGLEELLRVRPDLLAGDELRSRLQSSLLDALGRYEETQRRLHGVLVDEPAPKR